MQDFVREMIEDRPSIPRKQMCVMIEPTISVVTGKGKCFTVLLSESLTLVGCCVTAK